MTAFQWDHLPLLSTPRLLLGALTPDDATDLFAIYGDAAVMEFSSDPPFPDRSYIDQMLGSVQQLFRERQSIEWGIVLRTANRVVGTCGLHSFNEDARSAEVGCLLARQHWGQGIMREALTSVIAFGFDSFDLQVLHADIDAPNVRSLRLFGRLGFLPATEGSTMLVLTRQDWAAARGS